MTKDEAINRALNDFEVEQEHSTLIQIATNQIEIKNARTVLKWLIGKSKESKSEKLKESCFVLQRMLNNYEKVMEDIKIHEAEAFYFKTLNRTLKRYEKENKQLTNLIIELTKDK